MIDTKTNKILKSFGSVCEAERETDYSKTTISRQCRIKTPIRNDVYFRYQDDLSFSEVPIVVQYDFKTDKEIARYNNCGDAARKTGISEKVIGQQCNLNRKPKWTKSGFYFLRQTIDNKCVETIERGNRVK